METGCISVRPRQLEELLGLFLDISLQDEHNLHGILILGEAGVGKTAIAQQVALNRGYKVQQINFGNMGDPGDARGLPIMSDGQNGEVTKWAVSEEFCAAPGTPTVLLLDEITRAAPFMHSLIVTMMTSCSIAPGHYLDPEHVRVIATGNPWQDEHYQVEELDLAVRDRFAIVRLIHDWDDWYKWTVQEVSRQKLDQEMKRRAAELTSIVTSSPELQAMKTPRSWWTAIRELLSPRISIPSSEFSLLLGARIPGAAQVVEAIMDSGGPLPSVQEILQNPKKAIERIEELEQWLQAWGIRRLAYALTESIDECKTDLGAFRPVSEWPESVISRSVDIVGALGSKKIASEMKGVLLSLAPREVIMIALSRDPSLITQIDNATSKENAEIRQWLDQEEDTDGK